MNSLVAAAAVFAVLSGIAPETPFVFDNATCRTFLVGSWLHSREQASDADRMKTTISLDLTADGAATSVITGTINQSAPKTLTRSGRWDAEPGRNNLCKLTMKFTDRPDFTDEQKVRVEAQDRFNFIDTSNKEVEFVRQP
jgi:hypothetical protein